MNIQRKHDFMNITIVLVDVNCKLCSDTMNFNDSYADQLSKPRTRFGETTFGNM